MRQAGDLAGARAAYATAVAQKPDYAEARYNLANAWRDLGEFRRAETEIRALIARQADHLKAHNSLGVILGDPGRSAEAAAAFAAAMASLDPDACSSRQQLAERAAVCAGRDRGRAGRQSPRRGRSDIFPSLPGPTQQSRTPRTDR